MRDDLIMPRWAQPGVEVSHISYHSGAGLGSAYSEGQRGKITRVLKTQVEVEMQRYDYIKKENTTQLVKYKLKRGYKPFGEGNVRVDTLEETGNKWSPGHLQPTNGRFVARLRIGKEILTNSNKALGVATAFAKKNGHHVQLADIAELVEKVQEVARERVKLEERVLEVDAMPQDR